MYPHEVTDDYGALSVRVSTYLIIFGLVLLLLVIAFIRESAANARHNRETQRQMIEALGQMAALRVVSGEGPHGPAVQESHAVGAPVLRGGGKGPFPRLPRAEPLQPEGPMDRGGSVGGGYQGVPPLGDAAVAPPGGHALGGAGTGLLGAPRMPHSDHGSGDPPTHSPQGDALLLQPPTEASAPPHVALAAAPHAAVPAVTAPQPTAPAAAPHHVAVPAALAPPPTAPAAAPHHVAVPAATAPQPAAPTSPAPRPTALAHPAALARAPAPPPVTPSTPPRSAAFDARGAVDNALAMLREAGMPLTPEQEELLGASLPISSSRRTPWSLGPGGDAAFAEAGSTSAAVPIAHLTRAELAASVTTLERELAATQDQRAIGSARTALCRVRGALQLLVALRAPLDTTLLMLMNKWAWDKDRLYNGEKLGNPSKEQSEAQKSLRKSIGAHADDKPHDKVLHQALRLLNSDGGTGQERERARGVINAYLLRAHSYVSHHHPITAPASGMGTVQPGALVDDIDGELRKQLAHKQTRFFAAFSNNQPPLWAVRPEDVRSSASTWGAGRDILWLVSLAAWLHLQNVESELGLTFRERVYGRFQRVYPDDPLPVRQGSSVNAVLTKFGNLLGILLEMEEQAISPGGMGLGTLLFAESINGDPKPLVEEELRTFLLQQIVLVGSESLDTNVGEATRSKLLDPATTAVELATAFSDFRNGVDVGTVPQAWRNVMVRRTAGGGGGGSGGGCGDDTGPRERTRERSTTPNGSPRYLVLAHGGGGGGGGRHSPQRSPSSARRDATRTATRSPTHASSSILCHKCFERGHTAESCNNPAVCGNCYKKGHVRANCTINAVCSVCRKEGHLRADCPAPRPPTPFSRGDGDGRGRSSSAGSAASARSTTSGASQTSRAGTRYTNPSNPRRSIRIAAGAAARKP